MVEQGGAEKRDTLASVQGVYVRSHTKKEIHAHTWQRCSVSLATPAECRQGCNEHAHSDGQTDGEPSAGQDYEASHKEVAGRLHFQGDLLISSHPDGSSIKQAQEQPPHPPPPPATRSSRGCQRGSF